MTVISLTAALVYTPPRLGAKMHSPLCGSVLSNFETHISFCKVALLFIRMYAPFPSEIGVMLEVARPYRSWRCSISSQKPLSLLKDVQFVVTMEHYVARVTATHLEDRLTFKWLIAIRIVNPIIMYFFVSVRFGPPSYNTHTVHGHGQCFYSLLSLAFQVPFNRLYDSPNALWAVNA